MSNKQYFIDFVKEVFNNCLAEVPEEIDEVLEELQREVDIAASVKPPLTEKGQKVIDFMIAYKDEYDNNFSAKIIAEGIFCSTRAIAGTMAKLITDGYVSKTNKINDKTPTIYHLIHLTN